MIAHRDRFENEHHDCGNLHAAVRGLPRDRGERRDDEQRRNVEADAEKQSLDEERHRAEHGGRNEPVRPEQRPARDRSDRRPKMVGNVVVHRAGGARAPRELVDAERDEDQHRAAEDVGQPRAVSGERVHVRRDQNRRHARTDQRDRGREHLDKAKRSSLRSDAPLVRHRAASSRADAEFPQRARNFAGPARVRPRMKSPQPGCGVRPCGYLRRHLARPRAASGLGARLRAGSGRNVLGRHGRAAQRADFQLQRADRQGDRRR